MTFGIWHLDIHAAGRHAYQNRFNWGTRLPDGSCLTDPQHAGLLLAAKQYLWSMAVNPPRGRKRLSPSTLQSHGVLLQVIIGWMMGEGLNAFHQLDPAAVKRLCVWLRMRRGKVSGRMLAPNTVAIYLGVINTMFCQRDKLDDSPLTNPLPGETTFDAAGVTQAVLGSIPCIPDALAVDLLSKALTWVEVYAANIFAAIDLRSQVVARAQAEGRDFRAISVMISAAMQQAAIMGPDGLPLVGASVLNSVAARLVEACFILIAGLVGMRVSEILSMQVGAIEYHPIGETGLKQAYIAARLFKTADEPTGRPELWLAPEPVVLAVECLERLSAPLRAASGRNELFLAKNSQHREITPTASQHMVVRLNLFARHVEVPHHQGRPWPFSPHQFRKTFARFVARHDRSQLLALADHFKHISVSMTARGYVGSDFELHELVDQEGRAETALALNQLLASDRLGGRMGERIVARNHAFRGRVGEQVRSDYVAFILADTDLRIRGCDYGWCVFQAETALCGGEVAPNEAGRSPSVCAKCANLAVDDRHVPYWQDRRRRNLALWDRASPLARAVLAEAVEECDRMLRRIKEDRDGDRAEPNRAEPDAPAPDNHAG